MPRVVRLTTAELHYKTGIIVHTASSGAIHALNELYLLVEEDGSIIANGAIRTNIEYLNGLPEKAVRDAARRLAEEVDWRGSFDEIHGGLTRRLPQEPAPVQALFDCTLLDGKARPRKVPLAEYLGGTFQERIATNQTLFWSSDEDLERRARDYLALGFRQLKLRVGVGTFEQDLRRLSLLRDLAGSAVELSIDVNGRWSLKQATANLNKLAPIGLAYAEQPLPPGNWADLAQLSRDCPVPIMVDEGIGCEDDVRHLADTRAASLAHLKLVKLGGLTPVLAAARRLKDARVEVMIGQMNEGALATAAAAHCAMAVKPRYTELYGAYGLVDDPGIGIAYRSGDLALDRKEGLGITLDTCRLRTLWERRV